MLPSPPTVCEGVMAAPTDARTDRRRRGSTFKLAGASYLASAFAIVTGPLMARALGPTGRGEVAAALVYASILTVVAGAGIPSAVSYMVATKRYSPNAVLATTTRLVAWSLLPLLGVAGAVVFGPLSGLSTSARVGAAVLVTLVPIGVLGNCLNAMLVADGALGPMAKLRVIPLFVSTVVTVAFYFVGVLTVGLALVIAVVTVVGIAGGGWYMVHVRPAGRVPFRELIGFGLRGYVGNLAVFATHMIDQAVILHILGATSLGFYAVAVTISAVPASIALAIYARYFTLVAEEDDRDRRGALVSDGLRLTLVVTAVLAGGIAACTPFALPLLYGRPFAESVAPLLLLLPGTVAYSVSIVGESFLTAVGRPGRVTFAELIGFAITVVGLPLVVPRFGITGAATLSTISYVAVLVASLLFLRRVCPVSLRIRRRDLEELGDFARGIVLRTRAVVVAAGGRT
jgi:O-antigen/teichoic acid export membrane protein